VALKAKAAGDSVGFPTAVCNGGAAARASQAGDRQAPSICGQIPTTFGQVYPLLLDALSRNRAWLDDFCDEPITISADLHDVLLAYRHFSRSA